MRKPLLTLMLIATVLLTAVALPSTAAPVADLTALASDYPADTAIYAAFRTDIGFIEELDGLIDRFRPVLPPDALPDTTLRELLDELSLIAYGDDLETVFGSWVGATGAVGVFNFDVLLDDDRTNDADLPFMVTLSITDRAGAEGFTDGLIEDGLLNATITEQDGFAVYIGEGEFDGLVIAISDTTYHIMNGNLLLEGDAATLTDNDEFTAVTGLLPAADYNAALYADTGAILPLLIQISQQMNQRNTFGEPAPPPSPQMLASLDNLLPPTALGLTVLEGRTLTIDVAQLSPDYAMISDEFGVDITLETTPVDVSFAQFIPADAPLVLHDANLGADIDVVLSSFAFGAEFGLQQAMAMDPNMDRDAARFLSRLDAAAIRDYMELTYETITGFDLDEDVIPVFTGDWSVYARLVPSDLLGVSLDVTAVIEITDVDATTTLLDDAQVTLDEYNIGAAEEDGVVTIPGLIPLLLPPSLREAATEARELDFQIGTNDSILAIGTRPGVTESLAGPANSLADDAAFIDAQTFFLSDAVSVAYIGFAPLRESLTAVVADSPVSGDPQLQIANQIAMEFDSASITSAVAGDGVISRFALTLSE